MSNNKSEVSLEDIVSLCKRRGFIFPGSEVYGGLSGTWDYGPLGVTLKRNIMNLWWKTFVEDREDMVGVDAAILMNQKVWQASGHVDTFTDPLVECSNCKSRYRVDSLFDEERYRQWLQIDKKDLRKAAYEWDVIRLTSWMQSDGAFDIALDMANKFQGIIPAYYLEKVIAKKCEKCGKIEWHTPAAAFNMMFVTNIGPVGATQPYDIPMIVNSDGTTNQVIQPQSIQLKISDGKIDTSLVYLRPETAQGIFTNFKNVVDTLYPDLPFGIAQQGKAFRNEISPRDFVFRSREFEQMEIEYFVQPEKWEESFEMLRLAIHEWCTLLGLPDTAVHELEVPEDDRAHYSKRTIDFEFDFPIGRKELLGLAYRTDFDLGNIERDSGKNMKYTPKAGGKPFIPHVIEPSFGVERTIMAVLTSAYKVDEVNGEKRVYLALPDNIAPVKYVVGPLLKNKPELVAKAREVYSALKKKHGAVLWDDNANIGKRYRRADEIGVPYCVVIDFDSLTDNAVTVRDRNTTEQTRIAITELV